MHCKIKRINNVKMTRCIKKRAGHGTLLPYDKRAVESFHSILPSERRMKENRQNLSNWLQKLQLSCL